MSKKQDPPKSRYKIGAASALSGLPANTIRTWERRYGAAAPERTDAGGRRYSERDVERLTMMRRLTERGHAISELAELSDHALRKRLERSDRGGVARIGVLGRALAERWRREQPGWVVERLLDEEEVDSFRGNAVVVHLSELGADPARRAAQIRERTGATVFVLYEFAAAGVLERLASSGAWLFQAPVRELRTLGRMIRLASRSRDASPAKKPQRRFDDDALARLMEIDSPIQCECPQHLASLVSSLGAFEQYSRDCESRNAEDAALHLKLARGTARARRVMEELLEAVCVAEGLMPEDE